MAREITPTELGYLRSSGQKSDLYLAIGMPTVYMTARVNQTFTSYDRITELIYDSAIGTPESWYVGLTLYVGSTAGSFDKGITRIRKAPTASILYISETSEIQFADNDYLTIVDEIGLWPRHLVQVGDTTLMDWDVEYSAQHKNPLPVPVMGHDPVFWLPEDGAVTWQPDASESWVPGGTIVNFLWSAVDASYTSGMNTATPVMQWDTPGQYWVSCTVTASNGEMFTGHRRVYVYDSGHMPVTQFILNRCSGSYEAGGWAFEVTLYAEAARSAIRDRARVILFARDFYGGIEQSIGPYDDGTGNIVCSGWIDGESIIWDPELSTVTFTVQGPAFWLNKISAFPVGLKNVNTDPTVWVEMQNLTVDKALWHLLMWRSTAPACMDIILSEDTRLASALEAPAGSLWEQMLVIAEQSILAHPCCDRYGRLHVQVDTPYLAATERNSIPTVMAITSQDWQERIDLGRSVTPTTGIVDVAGISYDGTNPNPILARAPGHVYKQFGGITSMDRLLFNDQEEINTIAGAILASENNEYPNVDIELAMNNRMIDITPRQYVTMTVVQADTPRGVVFTDKKFIPRNVTFNHNPKTGALQTSLTLEAETLPDLAIMITPPQPPEENKSSQPTTPSWSITPRRRRFKPGMKTSPPFPATGSECETDMSYKSNGPFKVWGLSGLVGDNTNAWLSRVTTYKGVLRSSSHTHKSLWAIKALFQFWDITTGAWKIVTPTDVWFDVYALDSAGAIVATGVHDPILLANYQTGGFSNISAVDFDFIKLVVRGAGSSSYITDATVARNNIATWGVGNTELDAFLLAEADNGNWKKGSLKGAADDDANFDVYRLGIYGGIAKQGIRFYLPGGSFFPVGSRWHLYGSAVWEGYDMTGPFSPDENPNPRWHVFGTLGMDPTEGLGSTIDVVHTVVFAATDQIEAVFASGQGPHDPSIQREFHCAITIEKALDRRIIVQEFLLWNICTQT